MRTKFEDPCCIYHANCFDGMAAYMVVDSIFKGIPAFPMHYGSPLPAEIFEFKSIIVVDFSLPREEMQSLVHDAGKELLVLDHHKTAMEACEGLSFCTFDMNRSGAGLAWDYFYPEKPRPVLVDYIEDRDLWRFKLPDSKYVNAFIQSFPIEIGAYYELLNMLRLRLPECRDAGIAIERYKDTMTAAMCKRVRYANIGGFEVPVTNASLLFSEVGSYLCEHYPTYPFAAGYFIREDGKVQYSLRSKGNFDVSLIAKQYGGGGHKNAAGFEVDYVL